ncbi:MAG: hypothetical protein FWG91_08625 [Lachnospiraceae bacterium]|nr:hypothetical protein [Lachnospiraceae bacterium]
MNIDKIVDLIKIFLEKHLTTTIVSVAIAILVVALFPAEYLIERIENIAIGILFFCVSFVMIKLLNYAIRLIGNKRRQNRSLEKLTDKEKIFLTKFISRGEQAVYCYEGNYESYKEMLLLKEKNIVRMTDDESVNKYGFIQQWAFDELIKKPQLLEIKNGVNNGNSENTSEEK